MIVIDPSKGGKESGVVANGITEKDYNLLISEYIYNRLKDFGADVKIIRISDEYISEDDRADKIINAYGNNSKVVALSNMIGGTTDNAEVIYALRNNSTLASKIVENLEDAGLTVGKYYQRRSENDTSKDYYNIQKDTGLIETIIVNYGDISDSTEAENLKSNWEKYAEAVVKSLLEYQNIPYYKGSESQTIYTVQKGDSLYKIATKYNITVDKLKSENNLSSNLLSVGQKLVIPSVSVSDGQTYIVQKGDSLWSIATKFNTTVDDLKNINNLTSNLLSIGQVLKISDSTITTTDETYTVKKGDNLYKIANNYGITTEELKNYNNLTSNLLSIGQILKIPSKNSSSQITYTVKKGDSLWVIANKYNTSVSEIKSINNLTSNLLSIGQKLKIPN